MFLAFVPFGLFVGWSILRERYMRSARVLLLALACTALSTLVAAMAPPWSAESPSGIVAVVMIGLAAVGIAILPIFVTRRFEAMLSALPPKDYQEHKLLAGVRGSLHENPTATQAALALDTLDATLPVAEEWAQAREALKAQIRLFLLKGQSGDHLDRAEASDATARTFRAWRHAIARRARFFR